METGNVYQVVLGHEYESTNELMETRQEGDLKELESLPSTTRRLTLIGTGLFKPEEQEKLVSALEQIVGPYTVRHHRHTSEGFWKTIMLKS